MLRSLKSVRTSHPFPVSSSLGFRGPLWLAPAGPPCRSQSSWEDEMDSVTVQAFFFSAILESRRRGDQTGQVQGCKKLCPNCRGRMWPTFLGLFANVAQRRGVRTEMLAEHARIRSPVLPSRPKVFLMYPSNPDGQAFHTPGRKGILHSKLLSGWAL